jgi:hypothetical protein
MNLKAFILVAIAIICSGKQMTLAQKFTPENWIGTYSGTMFLSSGTEGEQQEIAVSLDFKEVIKDSSWTYIMTYKSEELGELTKNYLICKPAESPPHYFVLDELDGTKIDLSYRNDAFVSFFEVDGMFHASSLAKIAKNTLRFELYGSFSSQPTNVTNAELIDDLGNNSGSITVASFNPIYCQTVLLKKNRK